MISKIKSTFFDWHKEIPTATLAVYRIAFGALMLFSTLRFLANGWVHDFYIAPNFHFSYLGFSWLPYPNPIILYFIFTLLVIASLGILLGFFYRFRAILFFVLFTYVELLDKTTYLNHYYFVSLISFLLIFLPANRTFSLDTYFGFTQKTKSIPNWTVAILKFQIAIVYIFAGIAKLETDWLFDAQPLKYWLHTTHHWPLVGDVLKEDWVAYFFSWFGCLYDLFIVVFLLQKKYRNYAFALVIIFHTVTWLLFPIGVFPWVMIAGSIIFLSEDIHQRIIQFLTSVIKLFGKINEISTSLTIKKSRTKIVSVFFISYIAIQLLVPFRYLLYPGDIFWTEQGYRFSWRVMLMEKVGYAEFFIQDSEKKWLIKNSDYLTPTQEKMMSTQPDMILEYAHYLQTVYMDTTIEFGSQNLSFKNPEVHAEIYVTLNGRPSQLYVDKKHNLAAIKNDLSHRYWLEDYKK